MLLQLKLSLIQVVIPPPVLAQPWKNPEYSQVNVLPQQVRR